MKLKKSLFILCFALLFALVGIVPVSASIKEQLKDKLEMDELGKIEESTLKLLEKYYLNKDLGNNQELVELDSSEIGEYVESKTNFNRKVKDIFEEKLENYSVDFEVISVVQDKDYIILEVGSHIKFNYLGSNVSSGYGEVSIIVFKNEDVGSEIVDWYIKGDLYDEKFRGEKSIDDFITSISVDEKIEFKKDIERNQEIYQEKVLEGLELQKEKEIRQIEKTYNNKNIDDNISELLIDQNDSALLMAVSNSLSKSDIAKYARNNYNKTNPSSGNGSTPYYDFSQISGAYDCTNFVSHALLAGGAPMYNNSSAGIQGTSYWYYRSTANRSSSWAGVKELYSFLTSNTTKGPYGTSKSDTGMMDLSQLDVKYEVGNILQIHNGTTWRHSTIITDNYGILRQIGYSRFYQYVALVTGRTSPGVYNDNIRADTYTGDKRIITLKGYY